MFGFLELFVAWVVLAVWAALLAGRPGAPSKTHLVVWATGLLLGVCVVAAFYGIFAALSGAAPSEDPSEPRPLPSDDVLRYALYVAHGVLALGYLALVGMTARWLVRPKAT